MTPFDAWQGAAAYDDQSRRYLYFDRDGRKRLEEDFRLIEEEI